MMKIVAHWIERRKLDHLRGLNPLEDLQFDGAKKEIQKKSMTCSEAVCFFSLLN